jgi:hypothetical protein
MQTGMRCPACNMAVLTNQVIVGFPVIRITDVNKSAMTGQELLVHVTCFIEKMQGVKKQEILKV